MHGQQLDRRHAEVLEVVGHRRRGQSGVRPAQLLGHPVVQRGHALDVHLVDHGVAPAAARRGRPAPVEVVVDDDAARGTYGAESRSLRVVGVVLHVAEDRLVDDEVARHGPAVGVEQQLGGVEPQPGPRVPRPVGAVAVARAPRHARQRSVPHAQRQLGQPVARLDARPRRTGTPTSLAPRGRTPRSWSTPGTTSPPGGGCDPARPPWSRRRGPDSARLGGRCHASHCGGTVPARHNALAPRITRHRAVHVTRSHHGVRLDRRDRRGRGPAAGPAEDERDQRPGPGRPAGGRRRADRARRRALRGDLGRRARLRRGQRRQGDGRPDLLRHGQESPPR